MKNKQKYKLSVVAIIRDENKRILMVKQKTKHDPYPIWTIPGGRVERGENLHRALNREIKEETGIEIKDSGHVVSVVESDTISDNYKRLTVVFEIDQYFGKINVSDPDETVIDARFLSNKEVIEKMKNNPYRVLREHLIDYLSGKLENGAYINFETNEK